MILILVFLIVALSYLEVCGYKGLAGYAAFLREVVMFLNDVLIPKGAVILNWHVSCYRQTLGSAVRKILQCQLVPPSANQYGHHLTQLLHWLLVLEPTLRPTTEMIMAHVAVVEMCLKLTVNLGRVPVVDEKKRLWLSMQQLTCYEMAVQSVSVVLKRAFIDVTASSAVVTKHLIVFLNQTLMTEHFCVLQHVRGASL